MSKCKRCGQCCRIGIIHVSDADIWNEPRLRRHIIAGKKYSDIYLLDTTGGCPFLTADNLCEIYETRPRECREFEPGSNPYLCPQRRIEKGVA